MMSELLNRMLTEESGVALTEYVLIIALIALAALVGLLFYGNVVNDQYTSVGNTVDSA
jgi:Flp pilus assembly pilin Flp